MSTGGGGQEEAAPQLVGNSSSMQGAAAGARLQQCNSAGLSALQALAQLRLTSVAPPLPLPPLVCSSVLVVTYPRYQTKEEVVPAETPHTIADIEVRGLP